MTIGKAKGKSTVKHMALQQEDENGNVDSNIDDIKYKDFKNDSNISTISKEKFEFKDDDESSLYKGDRLTAKGIILIISLAGTIFAGCASYSLIAPFFPKIARAKKLSISEYSVIFAIYEIGRFIFPPFCSKLAIRMTPKVLLITGLFVVGYCCCIFGFLHYASSGFTFLALCIIVRIFWSAGGSSVTTTANLLATLLLPNHIPTVFAAIEIGAGLGVTSGPFFGGYLFEIGGFSAPFLFTSLFCVISIIPILLLVHNEIKPKKKNENAVPTTFADTLSVPGITINLFLTTATSFAIGFQEATLEYHLREIGHFSPSQIGYIFLISGFVYSFFAYGIGYIANRWVKAYNLIFIGLILLTIAFIVVGPLPFIPIKPNLMLVSISQTCMGVGTAFLFVLSFDELVKEAKRHLHRFDHDQTMSNISGLYTSSYALGVAVSPVIGAQLVERYGYRSATLPMSIIMASLVGLTMVYVFKYKGKKVV